MMRNSKVNLDLKCVEAGWMQEEVDFGVPEPTPDGPKIE